MSDSTVINLLTDPNASISQPKRSRGAPNGYKNALRHGFRSLCAPELRALPALERFVFHVCAPRGYCIPRLCEGYERGQSDHKRGQ